MTKDAYFELCEMLGNEPVDSDIPVEWSDLPDIVQITMEIYSFLPDRWEGMSATFLGKDYQIVFNLFETFDIDNKSERNLILRLMSYIDSVRSKIIQRKQKQKEKPS